jgi:uncharacterized protein
LKFTRENSTSLVIRSITADEIRIGDDVFGRTIALTTDAVLEGWPQKSVAELTEADFAVLLDANPEIIVLGTGPGNIFAPRELVFSMARRGVGFEVMTTAAAARTFNVLAGEGRRVASVLYLSVENNVA